MIGGRNAEPWGWVDKDKHGEKSRETSEIETGAVRREPRRPHVPVCHGEGRGGRGGTVPAVLPRVQPGKGGPGRVLECGHL